MVDISEKFDKFVESLPIHNGQICCCMCPESCFEKYYSIINIVIFETSGMTFLSYLILTFQGVITFPGSFIAILGMFVCFLWTGRFTGTFLNPALVISCMLKKQRSIPLLKGFVYILAEIIGAFVGTFIAWSISITDLPAPFQIYQTNNNQVGSFVRELLGTFIYLSSDTTFVEMDIQIWFSIPLILVGVCILFNLPLGINPAWSLTYQLVWGIYRDDFSPMTYCWTFIVGPILGAIIAGLFFELVFRKFILAYKVELKHEEQMFIQRLNEEERKKRKNRISQIQLV